ncbi:MAG: Flp pilus assembly complex ATPase component TadA [Planctomycetes bacterium]|nr:Flp pilus assembly complex ATPase component TadA [Planctomycetota bacterium]
MSASDDADLVDIEEVERRIKLLERSTPVRRAAYSSVRAHLEEAAFPRFIAWLSPRGLPAGPDARRRLEDDARVIVLETARRFEPRPSPADVEHVARVIVLDVLGTGPLQPFLDDPRVSEIMVNGPEQVRVERDGRIELTDVRFRDSNHLTHLIRKIAERMDRRVDFQSPTLDGRMPDGSRVHAILPPIALDGPVLTIRKYGAVFQQIEDLISCGSMIPEMAFYLGACVKARLNIAIGGPSASGKTTTLNVLASQVPSHERIVTIEELAELDLSRSHAHVVRLQARTDNVEKRGEVSIRDLVREALRMRADRIVVGEARGAEMLDVLQAMRCGHDGSMTTIHATSPGDLIERAVTIALFGNVGLSEASLRRTVVDSLDVLVLLARFADGQRKVVRVTEPWRDAGGEVRFNDVFVFDHTGYRDGRATGAFRRAGATRHGERFHRAGIELPPEVLGGAG